MKTTIALLTAALILTGCGDNTDDLADEPSPTAPATEDAYSAECGDAMADAAAVDEMQDVGEDLDPAFVACADLEAFAAASVDHPDALDGADPETFVANRCQFSDNPDVTGSDLCEQVSPG